MNTPAPYNIYDNSKFAKSQKKVYEALEQKILNYFDSHGFRGLQFRYSGNNRSEEVTHVEVVFSNENHYFKDSIYFKEPQNKVFMHFTTLETLYSILQSKVFRLYNLVHSDDPNELVEAAKCFGWSEDHNTILQKQIFTLSMCENIDDVTNYNYLWEKYGDNHKGVALIFKIHGNPMNWEAFHFSDIKYGQLDWFTKLANTIFEFNVSNPKVYIHIPSQLAFHKRKSFSKEIEVRLMYRGVYNFSKEEVITSWSNSRGKETWPEIHNDGGLSRYIELPLIHPQLSQTQKDFLKKAPEIELNAVVLGENIETLSTISGITDRIIKLSKDHLDLDFSDKIWALTKE